MPYWISCNSCFHPPGAERKLAVTTCGHVICHVCFQKGTQGECLICKAKCQVTPLSDKSSSEVKALFSDINTVTTKHFSEISKVLLFQSRHQKRLLTHYQQRNEKLEEVLVNMKQEMQQMSKKLNEQRAYIAKLESSLQHQSAKASVSQLNQSPHNPQGSKPVMQIQYNSPMALSRHPSSASLLDKMEVESRSLFRKPEGCPSAPRLSLISPPQAGHMGTVAHRSANQNSLHSAQSATVSRLQGFPLTPDLSYGQSSSWESPIFKPTLAVRYSSLSSLAFPPP